MKSFNLGLLILMLTVSTAIAKSAAPDSRESLEAQLRAREITISQLITQVRVLKSEPSSNIQKRAANTCDEDRREEERRRDREVTTTPVCTHRSGNGDCYIYGADQTGRDIQSAPNCTHRSGNGDCYIYGADNVGRDATCVPNCTHRSGNGQCYIYGPDICT